MRRPWRTPALVLLMLLVPVLAPAAWEPGGNRIGDGPGEAFVAAPVGSNRVVVGWVRNLGLGHGEVRAQAWTTSGDLAPGWPAAGVALSDAVGWKGMPAVAEDGAGGAFVSWLDYRGPGVGLRLQHVSADGSLAPGWVADGMLLGAAAHFGSRSLASDGEGGVLVSRRSEGSDARTLVHRIDGAGNPAPGWPVDGLAIPDAYDVGLVVDGERHVFVSAAELDPAGRSFLGLRVRRFGRDGAPDPGWPEAGALLTDASYPTSMKLFPDGAGGVFPAWETMMVCISICPPTGRWASRILADGSIDAGWTPPPQGQWFAPDGTGGMLVGMSVGGRPGALRLDADGSVARGWAAQGNAAMSEVVSHSPVFVTGDGRGGAYVAWHDDRSGEHRIYASRLDASGRLVLGWPATGSRVGTRDAPYPVLTGLVTLGVENGIALWEEWTPSGYMGYLLALAPGEPGPIAELAPVEAEVGFGVTQVRPNPTSGPIVAMVQLPNAGPARLDLVDAAGRLLETRRFDFWRQASGAVRFNESSTLRAGVYWLRLTQGAHLATKKLVVLE